jgi:mono/diheme cytochrome c family protein
MIDGLTNLVDSQMLNSSVDYYKARKMRMPSQPFGYPRIALIRRIALISLASSFLMLLQCHVLAAADPTAESSAVDFGKDVQPIFAKHCFECHGPKKQKSGFRLDLRSVALADGVAVVVGKANESPIIDYVTAAKGDESRMPPKGEGLSDAEVGILRKWIDAGADWPNELAGADSRLQHWAWQPVHEKHPFDSIDEFVLDKLKRNGLAMSPRADRETLIRRLSFDLHGLPPSPNDVKQFVDDDDPRAYEKLVDRLLASPHYGERFARHWLDIAHYADTHGFERDRRRDFAWRYRDYVIDSFNDDKPYDRFLQEQIAGDSMWPGSNEALIATGFLAAGPWDFVGQVEAKSGILKRAARSLDLDDMATQVITSTMAMTVNCARCHDHKIDPISQKEYYQIRAVFAGVKRADRTTTAGDKKQLEQTLAKLVREIAVLEPGTDLADVVGGGDGNGSGKRGGIGMGQGIDPRTGKPESKRMGFLANAKVNTFATSESRFIDGVVIPKGDGGKAEIPITSTGTTVTNIPFGDGRAWDIIRNGPVNSTHSAKIGGLDFGNGSNGLIGLHANAAITFDLQEFRQAMNAKQLRFTTQVGYFGQAKDNYFADARVFVDGEKVGEFMKLRRADGLRTIDILIPETKKFLTLMATDGGNAISMDQIGFGNPKLSAAGDELTVTQKERLASLRDQAKEVEATIAKLSVVKVFAVVPQAVGETKILSRGDAESPTGDSLAPGGFAALSMLNPEFGSTKTAESERRAALARWIADPKNPLTARVIVNRLWHWHFGEGIVNTPSDFGLGGDTPTHPELLDWLATQLLREKWSLKKIHRLIVTSESYRQQSRYRDDAMGIAKDANNRLLWRQNSRRIEAEAVRDSVLFVSGKLNRERGGPGFEDFKYQEAYAPIYTYVTADKPELWRRSIYRYIVRTTPDRFLTTLDCPDPANMTPKRLTTTTPLQSLTLFNNDFMLRQAKYFAERIESEENVKEQVANAFQLAFARSPSDAESQLAIRFIEAQGLFVFCRSLLNANEFVYVD